MDEADAQFRSDAKEYQTEIGTSVDRLRTILGARPGTGMINLVAEVERRLIAPDTATRDAVADLIEDKTYAVPVEGHSYLYEVSADSCVEAADALISRGYIRQAVTAEQVETAALKAKAREGCEIRWDLIGPAYRKEIRAVLEDCGIEVASDE